MKKSCLLVRLIKKNCMNTLIISEQRDIKIRTYSGSLFQCFFNFGHCSVNQVTWQRITAKIWRNLGNEPVSLDAVKRLVEVMA